MKHNAKLDINKYKNNDQETINKKFKGACVRSDIPLIIFLMEEKQLSFYPELEKISNECFSGASAKGGLETYKFLESLYISKNIKIPTSDFRTVCSKNLPGMVEYLLPKISKESIESGFDTMVRQDKLMLVKKIFETGNIKLNDQHFKTAWGYAPHVLVWIIIEQKYIISSDLEEWIKLQPIVIMRSMEPVFAAIKSRDFNTELENVLAPKTTIKENKNKI